MSNSDSTLGRSCRGIGGVLRAGKTSTGLAQKPPSASIPPKSMDAWSNAMVHDTDHNNLPLKPMTTRSCASLRESSCGETRSTSLMNGPHWQCWIPSLFLVQRTTGMWRSRPKRKGVKCSATGMPISSLCAAEPLVNIFLEQASPGFHPMSSWARRAAMLL